MGGINLRYFPKAGSGRRLYRVCYAEFRSGILPMVGVRRVRIISVTCLGIVEFESVPPRSPMEKSPGSNRIGSGPSYVGESGRSENFL